MFTILNRYRGTWGYFAQINSIILGLIFGLISSDWKLGLWIAIGYLLGESMGWGKWIGGIISGNSIATEKQLADKEGTRNGIDYITRLLFDEKTNYQKFCWTALSLRGLYWWFLTLLPLVMTGYLEFTAFVTSVLALAIGFPSSVAIGKYTTQKFNFQYRNFAMNGAWEHAEVWYGLMQDIIVLSIIYSMI